MIQIICDCRDTTCPVPTTTANVRGAYCGRPAGMHEVRHPTNLNRFGFPDYRSRCPECAEHAIKNGWLPRNEAQHLKDLLKWNEERIK